MGLRSACVNKANAAASPEDEGEEEDEHKQVAVEHGN